MDKELSTASAVIDLNKLPFKLGCALHECNALREKYDFYEAHNIAFRENEYIRRLSSGLKRISARSIHRMAKNCNADICIVYIQQNAPWDLMQLFYWNGCPELTVKILNLGWKKGANIK